MHAVSHMWITPHGIQKLEGERLQLSEWLGLLQLRFYQARRAHRSADTDLIMSEKHVVEDRLRRIDSILRRVQAITPACGHKAKIRAGDVAYLRRGNSVRSVQMVAAWDADPEDGKISVVSPFGKSLLGRRCGDFVKLDTLDGKLRYEIVKII